MYENKVPCRERLETIPIQGALIQKFLGWYGDMTGVIISVPTDLTFEGSFIISASDTGFYIRADIRDVKAHPEAPERDHVGKIQVEIVSPVKLEGL